MSVVSCWRFSRAHKRDQQTDTDIQTDRPRWSIRPQSFWSYLRLCNTMTECAIFSLPYVYSAICSFRCIYCSIVLHHSSTSKLTNPGITVWNVSVLGGVICTFWPHSFCSWSINAVVWLSVICDNASCISLLSPSELFSRILHNYNSQEPPMKGIANGRWLYARHDDIVIRELCWCCSLFCIDISFLCVRSESLLAGCSLHHSAKRLDGDCSCRWKLEKGGLWCLQNRHPWLPKWPSRLLLREELLCCFGSNPFMGALAKCVKYSDIVVFSSETCQHVRPFDGFWCDCSDLLKRRGITQRWAFGLEKLTLTFNHSLP